MISYMERLKIIARLKLLDPVQSHTELSNALDHYVVGDTLELEERCNLPRKDLKQLLLMSTTIKDRYIMLDWFLYSLGVPE
jgi:hypothetical protein